MRIGILQCGHFPTAEGFADRSYSDLYAEMLAGHGFLFETWSVVDMQFPESVHDADGWLVTGSKHGAYEDLPFIPPTEEFIRDAYAADVPIVGICFGHQIMAQALGGRVEKFSGGWSLGRQVYEIAGEEVALNAWHEDQVVAPPSEAVTVGRSAFCEHAAFEYRGRAFSLQPHPEFDRDAIRLLLEVRRAALAGGQAEAVKRTLDAPLSNAPLAQHIARFFKESVDV